LSVRSHRRPLSIMAQLEERRVKLDQYWLDYESVQTKIEFVDESESEHRATFEEAFYALSSRMRELASFRAILSPGESASTRVNTGSYSASEFSPQVRLPKLNLPTFSGQYDEWFPFFDTFKSLIHDNRSIDNIQRLQYLRASLTGDAKSLVGSLEVSAANYRVAWDLLKERYDNKRVIAQNHIKAILELPSMTRENAGKLRQIADGASRHLRALEALKRPTAQWDDLLVHILSVKLDSISMREWQNSLVDTELPTFKQFSDFIVHRSQMLEVTGKLSPTTSKTDSRASPRSRRQAACVTTIQSKCIHCEGEHSVYYCPKFLALTVPQRIAQIRKTKNCLNCLRSAAHSANKCPSGCCKVCKMKHNTLLHITTNTSPQSNDQKSCEAAPSVTTSNAVATHSSSSRDREHVMLATAIVHAFDHKGSQRACRVLLDCGSQANFVSRNFLNTLGIEASTTNISIAGINGTITSSSQLARIKLQSRVSTFCATIDCIVTDRITDKLPSTTLRRAIFELPRNIKLADPQFHVSSDIDLLIGAELFWQILCIGQIRASPGNPTLQKTRFGWILAGRLGQSSDATKQIQSFHTLVTNAQLDKQLSRFWQAETIENHNELSAEEAFCEQHFLNNVSRMPEGRYIIKLPFKEQIVAKLGDSKEIALRRLYGLEKRFARDPNLKAQYTQFLDEYLELGHMKLVEDVTCNEQESYYFPHHCVFKGAADDRRIRVVFDASCKSSTGVSLNDALLPGPVTQQDLMSILLRFRIFLYALAADIVKMYRQIMIHPSQTRYQRILWRRAPSDEVKTYELMTVTYGTSSASFLATRCLKHLAEAYQHISTSANIQSVLFVSKEIFT